MNDDKWTLEPYRFPDGSRPTRPPEAAPKPEAKPAPPPPPPPRPPKPPRGKRDIQLPRFLTELNWRTVAVALGIAALAALVFVAAFGLYVWKTFLSDVPETPSREAIYAMGRAPGIRFEDSTGTLIAVRGPRYGERVKLAELPPHVPQAFMAAEDRRFYKHGAVDLRGIARAAVANFREGRVVQGGSTITQQLAKGLFLTPDQTLKRKLHEAVMAHRLEKVLTKDEVLQLYLNRIFFGANTYGIDGASKTYFGKPASQLTLSEAALLAALPKAPSRLALTRDMRGALDRSYYVLNNMRREGWITAEQEAAAKASVPVIVPGARQDEGDIGYILDYATAETISIAGASSPDLVVRLTIDSRLQKIAAGIVRQAMATDGAKAGARQAALVALAEDGSVRVMVGGTDFNDSSFNRAVQAKRQPGSTFKPFVYAAALERGVLPTDMRVDGPVKFGDWQPENYGGRYRGTVTIETAFAASINTVAVKLAQEAGGRAVGELARRFGLTAIPPNPDLSVALGAYEVNLYDLVSAFQVFQQKGARTRPHMIQAIATVKGEPIYSRPAPAPVQVYELEKASMMVNMMKRVVTHGTGARAAFGRPAAGKTGTSQNFRDAWFIGFTPDYVAGVWVGNDDDKPMNQVAGGGLPSSIWRRFMVEAHKGLPARDFDWLLPDPKPETEPDPRNGFYRGLAADFGGAAAEAEAASRPPPEPVRPPPPPEPEMIPY